MPTMFTADVWGQINTTTGHVDLTENGTWHYDWPRNRMRNDFVVTQNGTKFNMTQMWLAAEVCVNLVGSCPVL